MNKADGRIIFNVLSSHLYRIQELFDEVLKTNRKVVIMGKKLQSIVDYAVNNKYLFIDKSCIGDLSNLNDDNVVIINSDERGKPYYTINKMVNGYDRFVSLTPRDTIVLASSVYEGREKTFYKLLDDISKLDVNVVTFDKEHLSHHASSEDLMMMIDLLKPKYYFPIKGEYRYQVANANLAEKVGIPSDRILLKENGFVASFNNGNLVEDFSKMPVGEILIDGDSNDDVGEIVLRDREMLSENGILIISTTLNKQSKKIVAGPEILTRGFIYVKDSTDLINIMKEMVTKIILENIHDGYVDYGKIKNSIRDSLSKYLMNQTGNKPMIISVLQEI